jgi:hypothetical protein
VIESSRKPSFRKNICPVCGGTSVIRNDKVLGFLAPKFNCPDCGAKLTTAPTPKVLLGFIVAFAGLPAALWFSHWLQTSFELHRTLLTAINGGLIGGITAYAFKLTLDGLAFKRWRLGGF